MTRICWMLLVCALLLFFQSDAQGGGRRGNQPVCTGPGCQGQVGQTTTCTGPNCPVQSGNPATTTGVPYLDAWANSSPEPPPAKAEEKPAAVVAQLVAKSAEEPTKSVKLEPSVVPLLLPKNSVSLAPENPKPKAMEPKVVADAKPDVKPVLPPISISLSVSVGKLFDFTFVGERKPAVTNEKPAEKPVPKPPDPNPPKDAPPKVATSKAAPAPSSDKEELVCIKYLRECERKRKEGLK